VRLSWAKYVRITDPGAAIDDPGNHVPPGNQAGFDLDAVAALHACDPSAMSSATPTPTPTPSEAASPTSSAFPPMTPTAPATLSPAMTATAGAVLPGDVDGNRVVDAADLRHLIDELFDGDGDRAVDAGGGSVHSTAAADVNGDGRITAADLTALLALRSP
jgi:dockerin type I repeat protein